MTAKGALRRTWRNAVTAVAAFGCLNWATHKTVPLVSVGWRLDGRTEYSLELWTVGTYCWAAIGVIAFAVLVLASVKLVIGQTAESNRHGFPIR
jgi:hypothetical protein